MYSQSFKPSTARKSSARKSSALRKTSVKKSIRDQARKTSSNVYKDHSIRRLIQEYTNSKQINKDVYPMIADNADEYADMFVDMLLHMKYMDTQANTKKYKAFNGAMVQEMLRTLIYDNNIPIEFEKLRKNYPNIIQQMTNDAELFKTKKDFPYLSKQSMNDMWRHKIRTKWEMNPDYSASKEEGGFMYGLDEAGTAVKILTRAIEQIMKIDCFYLNKLADQHRLRTISLKMWKEYKHVDDKEEPDVITRHEVTPLRLAKKIPSLDKRIKTEIEHDQAMSFDKLKISDKPSLFYQPLLSVVKEDRYNTLMNKVTKTQKQDNDDTTNPINLMKSENRGRQLLAQKRLFNLNQSRKNIFDSESSSDDDDDFIAPIASSKMLKKKLK